MKKKRRIFIAINLPEDIKKFLYKYSEKFQEVPAKWTLKDNLHITLEFLGDVDDQELADVCKVVGETVKNYNSFSIKLTGIYYGPDGKTKAPNRLGARPSTEDFSAPVSPRYVWIKGEKSKELSELKRSLSESLFEVVNITKNNKSFTPHITLGRIKEWEWRQVEPEERIEVNELIDIEIPVESIDVMESELKKGGPEYTIIESHQLS